MPLPQGAWEYGKSGYKLVQYMAASRPVVASPVGVNCDVVKEGVNGFVAITEEEGSQTSKAFAAIPVSPRRSEQRRGRRWNSRSLTRHRAEDRGGPAVSGGLAAPEPVQGRALCFKRDLARSAASNDAAPSR